jgi:hypothetical protein
MDQSEFADGIKSFKRKKSSYCWLWIQGLNQGLNMRDSIRYMLSQAALPKLLYKRFA